MSLSTHCSCDALCTVFLGLKLFASIPECLKIKTATKPGIDQASGGLKK